MYMAQLQPFSQEMNRLNNRNQKINQLRNQNHPYYDYHKYQNDINDNF